MEIEERKEYTRERNLKKKRAIAIAERDGITYIHTTWALGYDEDEVPDLKEEGYAQMALDTAKSIDSLGDLEKVSLEVDEDLKKERFMDILSSKTYFSIKGDKTRLKLKGILGRLKRAGYDTKYSPDMSTGEMWKCYFEARRNISSL